MGKDADIDAIGLEDEALNRIGFPLIEPAGALAVADEDLGDALFGGVSEDGADRVFGVKDIEGRAGLAGGLEVLIEHLLVGVGEIVLLDVNDVEIAVKALRLAAATADHERGIGTRRNANKNALVRAIDLLDPLATEIFFELVIDDIGGQEKGDLAEFGELAFADGGTLDAVFRRSVDDFDLVGGAEEGFGNGVGDDFAANSFDLGLAFLDVLEIDGSNDGNAVGEEFLDILPTFGMLAAGRVFIGKAVDEADGRVALEDGGNVDGGRAEIGPGGNQFEGALELFDFRGGRGLSGGEHHVLATHFAAAPLVEHADGLADAGGVAKKDFEAAARVMALFGLGPAQ